MRMRWSIVVGVVFALMGAMRAEGAPHLDSDHHWYFIINNGTAAFVEWGDGQESVTVLMPLVRSAESGCVLALPCKAEVVTVEWREHIPVYVGRWPVSAVHERLANVSEIARLTQVYPLVAIFYPSLGEAAPLTAGPQERVEKDGLWCKVVAASNDAGLKEKVMGEGMEVAPSELERIAKYADGRHSFVLVGIRSKEEYAQATDLQRMGVGSSDERVVALRMKFAAARAVMPAHTREFPGGWREDNICLLGNLRVVGARAQVKVGHFLGSERIRRTASGAERGYTRVVRQGEPEELWFEQETGGWTQWWAGFLGWWPVFLAVTVLWVALCSYVSGGLAGLVVERKWQGYARLGLWNLTTIVGLMLAARRQTELTALQKRWKRRLYVVGFTAAFMAINGGADWMLGLVMGKYWPAGSGRLWPWYGIGG